MIDETPKDNYFG